MNRTKHHFCGRECFFNAKRELYSVLQTDPPVIEKKERKIKYQNKCKICDCLIRKDRKFCVSCLEGSKQRRRSITKGEIRDQLGTSDYHRVVRNDSRTQFSNSHTEEKCVICNYSRHIEICHIKAVRDFDDLTPMEVINHIDNLVALCPTHHWEFDNGYLSQETFMPIEKTTYTTNHCETCGCTISKTSKKCKSCNAKSREKIAWPDLPTLMEMVRSSNYNNISDQLGVSPSRLKQKIYRWNKSQP